MDFERAGKPQKYFFKHFEDPAAKKYFEDSASTLVNHIPFKNSVQKQCLVDLEVCGKTQRKILRFLQTVRSKP